MTLQRRPDQSVPIRRWIAGDEVSAAHLNEMVDGISAVQGGVAPPVQRPDDVAGSGDATGIVRLEVYMVMGDYLSCTVPGFVGTPTGDDLRIVAKPWELQVSAFDATGGLWHSAIFAGYSADGLTCTIDGQNASVVAPYGNGDIIFAASVQVPIVVVGQAATAVSLDLNAGARAWQIGC